MSEEIQAADAALTALKETQQEVRRLMDENYVLLRECVACNHAIGCLLEDTHLLEQAIAYLQKHSTHP